MQYFYGDKTMLRVLDEIELWKNQESEHTVVIRQIVTNLENEFVEKLKDWEISLAKTEGNSVRYIEALNRLSGVLSPILYENIRQFINFALNESLCFVAFLNKLTAESGAIKNNEVAIVVINHIHRESEYLIGIIMAAFQYI